MGKLTVEHGTDSVRALAGHYDIFFVDQFGVLHDGQSPYPGAIDALRQLKRAGKTIALLSNSGKRSRANIDRIAGLGFDETCFDMFLTSGEVARSLLSDRLAQGLLPAGSCCLLLTRDDDMSAVEGLDLHITGSGEDADLVLIAGSRGDEIDLHDYERILRPAARRSVPAFCTNPDKVMLTPSGRRFGAGVIAERYESLGGGVTWIGKPHREIYRVALRRLGHPDPGRVCCVGDSIEHDIAGGAAIGAATAFVCSGIHAGLSMPELQRLFDDAGLTPDHLLPTFSW